MVSQGGSQALLPLKWTSVGATGGVGWDFRLADEWVLRPIANVSIGHVESDLSLLARIIESEFDVEIDFADRGRLTAGGVGGSIMLDFERKRES